MEEGELGVEGRAVVGGAYGPGTGMYVLLGGKSSA